MQPLLSFFHFPQHLWHKLRTTNIIERCFVECGGEPGPWTALSTWRAWTELFTLSSSDSTSTGKTAPSSFLHKRLDITKLGFFIDTKGEQMVDCGILS